MKVVRSYLGSILISCLIFTATAQSIDIEKNAPHAITGTVLEGQQKLPIEFATACDHR